MLELYSNGGMSSPCKIDIAKGNCCKSRTFVLAKVHFSYRIHSSTKYENILKISLFRCWNATSQTDAKPDPVSSSHAQHIFLQLVCKNNLANRKYFYYSIIILFPISWRFPFEIFSLLCYKSVQRISMMPISSKIIVTKKNIGSKDRFKLNWSAELCTIRKVRQNIF